MSAADYSGDKLPRPYVRRATLTDAEQGAMGFWSPEQRERFDDLVAWGQMIGQPEDEAICSAYALMEGLYGGKGDVRESRGNLFPTRHGGRVWAPLCGFCGARKHDGFCGRAGGEDRAA